MAPVQVPGRQSASQQPAAQQSATQQPANRPVAVAGTTTSGGKALHIRHEAFPAAGEETAADATGAGTVSVLRPQTKKPLPEKKVVAPHSPPGQPVVELRRAGVRYGRTKAISDVGLSVATGDIHAVVGPRGSGKTTVLRACAGLVRVSSGDVAISGEKVKRLTMELVYDARIVTAAPTPAENTTQLTVQESISLAPVAGMTPHEVIDEVFARFPHIAPHAGKPLYGLSPAQRTSLALVKACVTNPRLIIIDDIASGATDADVEQLAAACRDIASTGTGILLSDKNPYPALDIAETATVIQRGATVMTDDADAIKHTLLERNVATG